jgi:ribose-phosphate pyrophosphokinase
MARGAKSIDALVTHALYDESAAERLQAAGIRHICSSDSVTHPSNRLTLANLLADALRQSTA